MGGILGLWNRDGRPVDAAVLGGLRATLSHRTDLECLSIPAVVEAGSSGPPEGGPHIPAVAFDGRLDNRDELLGELGRAHRLETDAPDRALVIAAYRAWGDHFAERLSGDFALGVFDPSRRTLVLARDAIGVRPLYYFADPHVFIFASEIKAILAHPTVVVRPNDDVVADYLFNLFAAEDGHGLTFFEGISTLLPAHLAIVTPARLVTRQYWDFDRERRIAVSSGAEAVEGFREHFTRAVRRRLRPAPVAVSVSGGLDSSAIFCVAEQIRRSEGGLPLIGVSYTVADGRLSDEKRYLDDIERACGVEIRRWDDLPGGLMEGSREAIHHAEGPLLETRWTGTAAYHRAIRALGVRTLLTGHFGDQFLVDDAFLVDLVAQGSWGSTWRHASEYGRFRDDGIQSVRRRLASALVIEYAPRGLVSALRRFRRRFREEHALSSVYSGEFRARGEAAARRRPADARSGSAHARALHRLARSRYHVMSLEWSNKVAAMHGMDTAFPFFDRDLIAFVMAIPGELQGWRGVPKGLMREALAGVLPDAIRSRTSKADFTQDVNTEMAQDYDKLVQCLRTGGMAVKRGYVREQALADLERFRPDPDEDSCTLGWALADLVSLELWLQQFFGEQTEVL
jgi:asparagine synthase (glutamine-hydrolysing)